jgi:hypothetical protein
MRDHQHRASSKQVVHGLLDQALRLGIQRTRRLVEDKDWRIP